MPLSDRSSPEPAALTDLEDLFEHAPCGLLSIGRDTRIIRANATVAAWTGYLPQELVGKRVHDLLGIGGQIYFETHLSPLLRMQGFVDEVALEAISVDGAKIPVLASINEKRVAGEHVCTRVVMVKAAERRRYERNLLTARDEALRAKTAGIANAVAMEEQLAIAHETADMRDQFIAILGHDLRNPLASIIGGTRLLERESLSDRGKRILNLMQASAVRASGLIDNVMDFARGRLTGGISLAWKDEELAPMIEQVISETRMIAPTHRIELELSLPEPVRCDPSRIGQLLSNLLGNAISYGSTDQPVRVRADSSGGSFELSVANGGTPISPEAIEKLFEPFFRSEGRARQAGLGLGLHIASEIAKAHGGTLHAVSSADETRFTFTMPVKA